MPGLPSADALRTEALTARVRRRDVRRHRRSRGGASRAVDLLRFVLVPATGVVACLVGALALAFGITEELASSAPDRSSEVVAMGVIAVGMLLGGLLLSVFLVRGRTHRLPAATHLRLARFAEQNGLAYEPGPEPGALPAVLERRGRVVVRAVVRAAGPPETEVGDLELRVGDGSAGRTRLAGYCAMRMSRPGPGLLLRSDSATGHPLTADAPPDRAQRVVLQGGAAAGAIAWCPAGYEDDARFLLTSDVVAALSDPGGAWDLEVVGEVLLLSRPEAASGLDGDQWRRIAAAADLLEHRLEQWTRWRSQRSGAPALPEGTPNPSPYLPLPSDDPVPAARLRTGRSRQLLTSSLLAGGVLALVLLSRLLDR